MKSFMKICGIIALILFGAGVAFTVIGVTIGGPTLINEGISAATDGRLGIHMDYSNGDFGLTVGDYSTDDISRFLDSVMGHGVINLGDKSTSYDLEESVASIENGSVEYHELACAGVEELKIHVEGCSLVIEKSSEDDFWLEAKDVEMLQAYAKGDTLYLTSTCTGKVTTSMIKDAVITLYIPQGYYFDRVEIDLGAGEVEAEEIFAKELTAKIGAGKVVIDQCDADKLDINVGAGDFEVDDVQTDELKCEVGMGNISLSGTINGDAKAECIMGNISLKLSNAETDFDYKLEAYEGNITLGGKEHSKLVSEEKIDNDASQKMKLKCSMGNIDVSFEEE